MKTENVMIILDSIRDVREQVLEAFRNGDMIECNRLITQNLPALQRCLLGELDREQGE